MKGLLIDSKLPVDTLGRIWDLADMDKDGSLDRHEFVVVRHIIYLFFIKIYLVKLESQLKNVWYLFKDIITVFIYCQLHWI